MADTAYRRFLSKSLYENGNKDINSSRYWNFGFCICYRCGHLLFSYPYGITLSVVEMEKAVGIVFMALSISIVAVNLPFVPFKLNVVSWWILISGVMDFLYFYYDWHGFLIFFSGKFVRRNGNG
mgnify:CR=1 FL=1